MKNDKSTVSRQKTEELNNNSSVGKDKKGEDYFADFDFENLKVDMQLMLKSGVHFGHQKARKNPKMEQYIFGTRNGVNIIDLQKTVEKLEEAKSFIEKTVSEGEIILLVGTKKQAKNLIQSMAQKCSMPYVVERWLGGTFTNFKVMAERTKFLRDGQEKLKKNEYSQYTKFEQMKIIEELDKLEKKMGGIKNITKIPSAIFVTGLNEDKLAVREAQKVGIPVIALADTNVNPEGIDFPIPSNEDAVSSLKLMLAYICQAILNGQNRKPATKEEDK